MSESLKHDTPLSIRWHAIFIAVIVVLRLLVSHARDTYPFIMHHFWPLSVFTLSKPFVQDIPILLALLGAYLVYERLLKESRLGLVHLVTILLMVIGTNVLQGYESGLVQPIIGQGVRDFSYWSDATILEQLGIQDFLKHYSTLQPTLSYHGRVHPPGPTILLNLARTLLGHPVAMSITYALISVGTVIVIYKFLRQHVSESTALYVGVLYGILPAFQIYGLASIDSIIALTSVVAISSWHGSGRYRLLITSLATSLTALLNFSVVWLVLVLLLITPKDRKNERVSLLGTLLAFCIALYTVTGYDYLKSFLIASQYEGTTAGWYGLADPASYVVTRLQGIVEPLVFLGPAVTGILFQSIRRTTALAYVGKASILSFCLFLAAGAYYTGETARAALYVIPPILFATAPYIEELSLSKRVLLTRLVFGQTIFMQLIGYYSW